MGRLVLVLKGMAMGTADVIPGVSGGTLALILGIYTELVDTIKGVSPRIIWLFLQWLKSGRKAEDWQAVVSEFSRLNIMFLVPLFAGIISAIVIGSVVIPTLMENYPVAMRGLFFGLIAASVFVPFRMIQFKGSSEIAIVALAAVMGCAGGFVLTDPGHTFQSSQTWTTHTTAEATPLKEVLRRGPSAMSSEQVYWAKRNDALRSNVELSAPALSRQLTELRTHNLQPTQDKATLKARSIPYDTIQVPKGTPVHMPQPALWFIFVAGLIAICAMILPGISGSYLLLVLGVYFFVLNSLKGLITLAAHGEFSMVHLSYVTVFVTGCLIGILSFARVLSYLLHNHASPTLGVLVGLMLGCLRGIWPFREEVEGVAKNYMPTAFDQSVGIALGACLIGFIIVAVFTWLGRVRAQGAAINA